jgi:hypothetical protein
MGWVMVQRVGAIIKLHEVDKIDHNGAMRTHYVHREGTREELSRVLLTWLSMESSTLASSVIQKDGSN